MVVYRRSACLLLIFVLSVGCLLTGCSNVEDNTIKLTFSQFEWKDEFTATDDIEAISNKYKDYYLNVIALYNYQLTDNFKHTFDYYDEYAQLETISNEMQTMQADLSTDEDKLLAAQMSLHVASTSYLLSTTNLDTDTIKDNMEAIKDDIKENYEWIAKGLDEE